MTFTNLLVGYIVDYQEYPNKWVLLDEHRGELLAADSLSRLREWVDAEEKKGVKTVFPHVPAIHFDPRGYVTLVPRIVTVTSQYNETEYWISIPGEGGKRATRAKVENKYLFAHTLENIEGIEFAERKRILARAHTADADARLKTLTPFVK